MSIKVVAQIKYKLGPTERFITANLELPGYTSTPAD